MFSCVSSLMALRMVSAVSYTHLQLRIAMRMSYVNPTEAQRIAQKAVEAGVIESNEDNAMLHVAENLSLIHI